MSASIVQIRMDSELRDSAAETFESLGLDLPTAIRIFLKKSIAVQGLPFDVRAEIPNEETRKAIENAERGIGLSRSFSSVAELMEDLNADD
ncbi:MAG: type II toxin-antitoxin system RelB/DinJ family antitoxin [Clostridia bacterium]|nr:type II toxin-antitoxin system RelB/DinJ family antitoxin [Clostridia bacterium]